MKVYLLLFLFNVPVLLSFAQNTNINSLTANDNFDNIFSVKIAGDSLCTSFIIWIKKEVKLHKHSEHSEHVYVLEGEGNMKLGNKMLKIKTGDLIFIPKNTPHKVVTTSTIPLKVLSIQSPSFDGSDRILLE